MNRFLLLSLLSFAFFMAMQFSSVIGFDCNPNDDGPCVRYFKGPNCYYSKILGNYTPTCEGNCFQYDSFGSVEVTGYYPIMGGPLGTDCIVYADRNCSEKLGDTGNVKDNKCLSADGQSMRCFYNCNHH